MSVPRSSFQPGTPSGQLEPLDLNLVSEESNIENLKNDQNSQSLKQDQPSKSEIHKLETFGDYLESMKTHVDVEKIHGLMDSELVSRDKIERDCFIFGYTSRFGAIDYGMKEKIARPPGKEGLGKQVVVLHDIETSVLISTILKEQPNERYRIYITSWFGQFSREIIKTIFFQHGLNPRFLESILESREQGFRGLGSKSSPIGYRTLNDKDGAPLAYDLYLQLPMKGTRKKTELESWKSFARRKNTPLINTAAGLECFDMTEDSSDNPTYLSDRIDMGINLRYNIRTRKTIALYQIDSSATRAIQKIQNLFENIRGGQKEDTEMDPFSIFIPVLMHWLWSWGIDTTYLVDITNWLDVKVQAFITTDGNEKTYQDLNSKCHFTERFVFRMGLDIELARTVLKTLYEQHTKFLAFTGLNATNATQVQEQLEVIGLDIENLAMVYKRELDKVQTSLAWLSSSAALKHTQAMRIAGEASYKASEAMKNIAADNFKESEIMKRIAVNTQRDSQSMKVIAFLTMFYLPGAFVSSIFGWSIMSFEVAEDGTQSLVVASQWWIFLVATVILTIFTMGCCFAFIWWSRNKVNTEKSRRAATLRYDKEFGDIPSRPE